VPSNVDTVASIRGGIELEGQDHKVMTSRYGSLHPTPVLHALAIERAARTPDDGVCHSWFIPRTTGVINPLLCPMHGLRDNVLRRGNVEESGCERVREEAARVGVLVAGDDE
jgi:hypothetical protein